MCVYYMTGTPEGSTESSFMEKPGIELATSGLQGIALIHSTTGGLVCAFVSCLQQKQIFANQGSCGAIYTGQLLF